MTKDIKQLLKFEDKILQYENQYERLLNPLEIEYIHTSNLHFKAS